MKTVKLIGLLLIISVLVSCEKKSTDKEDTFVFLKSYCATVTVGGVVGITEKCFNPGDTVTGKQVNNGMVTIRIAGHSELNDLPANPNSFQEFLDVPAENLKLIDN